MENLMIEYNGEFVPKALCTNNKKGIIDGCVSCSDHCKGDYNDDCNDCEIQKCFTKLAAYERTLLEPEDVKDLVIDIVGGKYSKWNKILYNLLNNQYIESMKQ